MPPLSGRAGAETVFQVRQSWHAPLARRSTGRGPAAVPALITGGPWQGAQEKTDRNENPYREDPDNPWPHNMQALFEIRSQARIHMKLFQIFRKGHAIRRRASHKPPAGRIAWTGIERLFFYEISMMHAWQEHGCGGTCFPADSAGGRGVRGRSAENPGEAGKFHFSGWQSLQRTGRAVSSCLFSLLWQPMHCR